MLLKIVCMQVPLIPYSAHIILSGHFKVTCNGAETALNSGSFETYLKHVSKC